MSPTLDYRLKGGFSLLANNPDNPCLINVLMFLILHANGRGRCWISLETIAKNATRSDPGKAVHAKRWLIEHDAIKLVPYEKRVGDEINLPKRQHIFQLTGFIRDGDMIYPYLYLSEADLDEFKKAAEDVAGDIINQIHTKPKSKRIRDHKFISISSKSTFNNNRIKDNNSLKDVSSIQKSDISSNPSQNSDVHIIDVPSLSISNISKISTTYQNFQESENSGQNNAELIDNAIKQKALAQPSHIEYINSPPVASNTESDQLRARLLLNNNSRTATVYIDPKGEPVIDPSLILVAPNGFVTYICPSCRSYITEQPNQLCSKCRNVGIQVDVKIIEALAENADSIEGKYSKEIKQKVQAVQFAIIGSWPGKSQAYGWAGKIAQMLVGVSPKKSGDYYTHRLRQEATPDEVIAFAAWWAKTKADNGRRAIEMPSSPEALEKFFSEFREAAKVEAKKKEDGKRKYIEIDLDEYK